MAGWRRRLRERWRQRWRFHLANGVEGAKLMLFRPARRHHFFVVTAVYDAGPWIERHLESVRRQRYDSRRVTHLIIDDASTDDTAARIERWRKAERPAYDLRLIENEANLGGCANYVRGFRDAPPDAIVLQLDGDDWLPDSRVLAYLNMVYQDEDVWMTYNTWVRPDGEFGFYNGPLPEQAEPRRHPWVTSHLHSFRAPLFEHVKDEDLRDPKTGEYWKYAVDHACYLPMLELAGRHAVHLDRTTYVYNLHPGSVLESKREAQLDCETRIRAMPRYAPLPSLD